MMLHMWLNTYLMHVLDLRNLKYTFADEHQHTVTIRAREDE